MIDPRATSKNDAEGWDSYWSRKDRATGKFYDAVATAYRTQVIRRNLEHWLFRVFPDGSRLLHAGCGSGGVDSGLHSRMKITAVDISPAAVSVYRANNPDADDVRQADIFALPFERNTFDGAYNLGVLEHFTTEEIVRILSELNRVLKPNGKIVIFWPHVRGTSVAVLKGAHWFLRSVLKRQEAFHPPEISLIQSAEWVSELLARGGFALEDYSFGPRDFFVQAVVVAVKRGNAS